MLQQHAPYDHRVCACTVTRGDLDMLCLLKEHNTPCCDAQSFFRMAALAGHLHIVQYLHQIGVIWPEHVLSHAARSGNVDLVKWMVATNNAMYVDPGLYRYVASSGNVKMLEYCISTFNATLNSSVAVAAAEGGHLHVLDWLHSHSIAMDDSIITMGAALGSFEVLKWAQQHGFKPQSLACELARNDAIQEWLHANNCMCPHAEAIAAAKSQ